ncbi:MAG: D-tyrosyl-tRNA(Tyr) deacylase [Bacteroidales bacterium]|jgi:D-tyrosyl-tRNA(Tyr) deacylase|nr:D-tyrosyl-tRNA(Tyr) deacylase [Bacteroidales bacterium]
MRIVIQRVSEATVSINGEVKSSIGNGLLLFVGIEEEDNSEDISFLCKKSINLRIFDDQNGVMNRSVSETEGEILVVSQFTLHASTRKGNRPSYIRAAKPEISIPMYKQFCTTLAELLQRPVQTGEFGADMKVQLVNDGPVTIWIDSKNRE